MDKALVARMEAATRSWVMRAQLNWLRPRTSVHSLGAHRVHPLDEALDEGAEVRRGSVRRTISAASASVSQLALSCQRWPALRLEAAGGGASDARRPAFCGRTRADEAERCAPLDAHCSASFA